MFGNFSQIALASSLDDVNISISSIYLLKNINDGQMDAARHSSWFIYEITSLPDMLDPMGSSGVGLLVFPL